MSATSFYDWSKAHQADHITGRSDFVEGIVSSSNMNVVQVFTLNQRQRNSPCRENTSSHLFPWRQRSFICKVVVSVFWEAKRIVFIDCFADAAHIEQKETFALICSIESIMPTCWDSYKELSNPCTQENWQKRTWLINTPVLRFNDCYEWLWLWTGRQPFLFSHGKIFDWEPTSE